MEDTELLLLLHKDPGAGMEQLMNKYAGLVYAVVKERLCAAHHVSSDIEDCVADVFSIFYTDLANYDPKLSSIKSYLCVIARRRAINVAKWRSRQQNTVSLDDEELAQKLEDDVPLDSVLAENELRREVLRAIKELGEPDAGIIFRKYYLGESSREIADALGMTVSNVDTRTHRALKKLKELFGSNI